MGSRSHTGHVSAKPNNHLIAELSKLRRIIKRKIKKREQLKSRLSHDLSLRQRIASARGMNEKRERR